jgi:hypothetical protein
MKKSRLWGPLAISFIIVLTILILCSVFASGRWYTSYGGTIYGLRAYIWGVLYLTAIIYLILILIKNTNWRKIIVFVILFLISNVTKYIPFKDCWAGKGKYVGNCEWKFCQPSFFLCQHTEASQYYLGIKNLFLQMIFIIFFMFIFPYLLASFVIWLYDKSRKKTQ